MSRAEKRTALYVVLGSLLLAALHLFRSHP